MPHVSTLCKPLTARIRPSEAGPMPTIHTASSTGADLRWGFQDKTCISAATANLDIFAVRGIFLLARIATTHC